MEPAIQSAADAKDGASTIVPFHRVVPYAIAACLMAIGISQALQIIDLKKKLAITSTDDGRLQQTVALMSLRVAILEAKDPAYASSRIMIAWDAYQHRGVLALQDLSAAPAGHDYQLWVLDPNALGPISAGLITGPRSFDAQPITTDNPGFAVSLEQAGGSPAPVGPILFAVAPGP
jgi:anti-sigma-K factor RskA